MKQTFRGKWGLEILLPTMLLLGILAVLLLKDGEWLPVLFISPAIFLLAAIFLFTRYTIHDQKVLEVKCAFLYHKWIGIHTIRIIRETNNPISSPATSLDRLELVFEHHGRVMISPAHKEAFIQAMLAINPGIEVLRRKKTN